MRRALLGVQLEVRTEALLVPAVGGGEVVGLVDVGEAAQLRKEARALVVLVLLLALLGQRRLGTVPRLVDRQQQAGARRLEGLDEHSQHYNIGMFGNLADTRVCAEFGP